MPVQRRRPDRPVRSLKLRVGLYVGLLLGAPVWLYQLWAFIAPGLHRNERKYTYAFVGDRGAAVLRRGHAGAIFVVSKSLHFLLGLNRQYNLTVDLPGYFNFVTNMMLLFGAGFEFPLIMLMLNFVGLVSAASCSAGGGSRSSCCSSSAPWSPRRPTRSA